MFNIILQQINKIIFLLSGPKRKTRILRAQGMKIGENCLINTASLSTERYLIEIGDHVVIGTGSYLITHDGSAWVFRTEQPELDIFGKIKIGDNTFIGTSAIILPNTVIGKNCIVGAGSVVRGRFPDNSVIMGNPAKAVLTTTFMKSYQKVNKNALMTKKMTMKEKHKVVKKHFNLD
jgi:acetyltransferase-like isoleucine patch superfamily enzyme